MPRAAPLRRALMALWSRTPWLSSPPAAAACFWPCTCPQPHVATCLRQAALCLNDRKGVARVPGTGDGAYPGILALYVICICICGRVWIYQMHCWRGHGLFLLHGE